MKWLTASHHLNETDNKQKKTTEDGNHATTPDASTTDHLISKPEEKNNPETIKTPSPQPKKTAQTAQIKNHQPSGHSKDTYTINLTKSIKTKKIIQYFTKNKTLKTLILLIFINTLAYLSYTGHISHIWSQVIGEHINKVNQAYLSEARIYTADLLKMLSESKMVLSLLQSSQGGISFFVDVQIQLGETLSTLSDAVEYAWKISLSALSAIEFLSLALDISHYSMAPVLTLLFILLSIYIITRQQFIRLNAILYKLVASVAFIVLLSHFLIPAAVFTSAIISQDIFSKHRNEIYRGFSSLHSNLPKHNSDSGLKNQVKSGIRYYKDNQKHMHKHTHRLTSLSSKHMIINLVEYILLPLLILYLLSRLRFFLPNTLFLK